MFGNIPTKMDLFMAISCACLWLISEIPWLTNFFYEFMRLPHSPSNKNWDFQIDTTIRKISLHNPRYDQCPLTTSMTLQQERHGELYMKESYTSEWLKSAISVMVAWHSVLGKHHNMVCFHFFIGSKCIGNLITSNELNKKKWITMCIV